MIRFVGGKALPYFLAGEVTLIYRFAFGLPLRIIARKGPNQRGQPCCHKRRNTRSPNFAKMKNKTFPALLILLSSFFASGNGVLAQCPFDPTIEGDTILCPGDSTVLKTQTYDSYQWYRRAWGSTQAEPIPGATGPSIVLTATDALNYYSVAASLNGCTEHSPEVLLDEWAFLLPTLSISGDYVFEPGTQTFFICTNDTMLLTLNPPYEASITWYNNGVPIPGETDITLPITQSGTYSVVAAPAICPYYILSPGVVTHVEAEICSAAAEPSSTSPLVEIGPNPAGGVLHLRFSVPLPSATLRILAPDGRECGHSELAPCTEALVDVSHLPAGLYLLQFHFAEGKTLVRRFIKN